jgi:hypothetical protein
VALILAGIATPLYTEFAVARRQLTAKANQ